MRTSIEGKFAIAAEEGIVPGPYLDSVQVWTFGIGHTRMAGEPTPEMMPKGIPTDLDKAIAKAVGLFEQDLIKYERGVLAAIKVPMKQNEFDAFVSFHYNTGAIEKARLTAAFNRGQNELAAKDFLGWANKARRERERRMFLVGEYPPGPINVWSVSMKGNVIWKPLRHIDLEDFSKLLGKKDA